MAEGNGHDLFGGGQARPNGADPRAEGPPDLLGCGCGGDLQQALGDLPDAQRRLVRVQWPELPDSAEIEGGLVRLALRNLLRNAFAHGGPAVSVMLQCEMLAVPPALVISVTDDGVGPPPDWQLAPQGDPPRQPGPGGKGAARGLGLYIVREVMARHGGSLSLQPRHPHGLVARLVFPQRHRVAAA